MARLIYSTLASLDGYVEDGAGAFDWAEPDEVVHAFINDLMRPIGTHLLGRRMHETMQFWESGELPDDAPAVYRDFESLWRGADKVVFSTTLPSVHGDRCKLERSFDPDRVRHWKQASDTDLSIGGSELAGSALAAGVVDELHLFVIPVVVGGGKPAMPASTAVALRLLDTRTFDSGVVYLRYSVQP